MLLLYPAMGQSADLARSRPLVLIGCIWFASSIKLRRCLSDPPRARPRRVQYGCLSEVWASPGAPEFITIKTSDLYQSRAKQGRSGRDQTSSEGRER